MENPETATLIFGQIPGLVAKVVLHVPLEVAVVRRRVEIVEERDPSYLLLPAIIAIQQK